ncbi:MAG: site-specific integrase, partial [Candidatus Hodarchaeota archaeon]
MAVKYMIYFPEYILVSNISSSSKRTYKSQLNQFFQFLGNKPLNRKNVAKYLEYLENKNVKEGKKLSDKTILLKLTIIRRFTKFLWEENQLSDNEYK